MESIDRDRLLRLHTEMTKEARSLMEAKNHDYSGGKDASDPFLNFTRVEKLGITDTKTGFLVRMTDKISRLITFCRNGTFKTKDEALKDTILDLINYSVLLYAYSQTEKDDYKE
ncbi:MAG: hypothetical protein Unbinned1327contig1000_27 [Prokaryotic dsDNA virus sp.]|nr:MAG: hypothetical protein Unbinned1327contig1000_27 [Prokaryotic dsDNA virus sp.]|tara:strand:- start:29738 stop:30079 length:342 start_codon:yes stop_codon:yes gene_type:complete